MSQQAPPVFLKGDLRMLVLSRRLQEKILFPTLGISVQVLSQQRGLVRLGITAPPETPIYREEVYQREHEWSDGIPRERESELDKLNRLLQSRLTIAAKGLELLHEQLEEGAIRAAEEILDKLADELELLKDRFRAEIEKHRVGMSESCSVDN
jgi:carbon storage regulator CsrA